MTPWCSETSREGKVVVTSRTPSGDPVAKHFYEAGAHGCGGPRNQTDSGAHRNLTRERAAPIAA